jgi:hypothetical protein
MTAIKLRAKPFCCPGSIQSQAEEYAAKGDEKQRRQDAAARVSRRNSTAKFSRLLLGYYQRRDQITANHEKHVDPDEAAAKRLDAGMEQNDRRNGNRPQPVNFAAIFQPPFP